jgi:hypothetical protein
MFTRYSSELAELLVSELASWDLCVAKLDGRLLLTG